MLIFAELVTFLQKCMLYTNDSRLSQCVIIYELNTVDGTVLSWELLIGNVLYIIPYSAKV